MACDNESTDMMGDDATWILEDVQRRESLEQNDQASAVMSADSEDATMPAIAVQPRKRLANGKRIASSATRPSNFSGRSLSSVCDNAYNLLNVKVENHDWEPLQTLQQPQSIVHDDIHETFGRYIASELRQCCNPQALITCKQDIYRALSRMQNAAVADSLPLPHVACGSSQSADPYLPAKDDT